MRPGTHTFNHFRPSTQIDAACLAELMKVNYGGTEITFPGCGADFSFPPPDQAPRLRLPRVRPSHLPMRGHDLPQASTKAHQVVFRDVPDDQHSPRRSREGIAAAAGFTYKTAWRMSHELGKLILADFGGPLGGAGKHVEVDETYGPLSEQRERRAKGSKKALCSAWSNAAARSALARSQICHKIRWNPSFAVTLKEGID